jgi:hypothetical protein
MARNNEWTDEQLREIKIWLEQKWKDMPLCPACGQRQVFVAPSPAHVMVGAPDGVIRLGESYPCVALICRNCGNLQMVSALVAQIGTPVDWKEDANG